MKFSKNIYFDRDTFVVAEGCPPIRSGKERVWCQVDIEIDLDAIASVLGRRAALNKTGKSRDGFVTVRRATKVEPVKERP